MDPYRFRPQLEEIEGRLTPAVSAEQAFVAGGTAAFFFNGTHAALVDQRFIAVSSNRAGTQSLAATIVAQSPVLADTLGQYVAELRTAQAAADPRFAGAFNPQIERFTTLANLARLSGIQAQAVSDRIDVLNTQGTTGSTGTTSTGVTGLNGLGTGTATNNTLPANTGSTNTGTTTPGTTTGTTGAGTGSGTGATGTTPGTTTGSTPGTTTGGSNSTTPIGTTP